MNRWHILLTSFINVDSSLSLIHSLMLIRHSSIPWQVQKLIVNMNLSTVLTCKQNLTNTAIHKRKNTTPLKF